MRPDGYWLGLVGGVIVLLLSLELVRRRQVRGRLALAWVVLGAAAVVLALFPDLLGDLSAAVNVQVPLNLVLFSGVLFLLVVSMQLASEVGRLESRTRRLAEEVALLRAHLPAAGGSPAVDPSAPDTAGAARPTTPRAS
ncbi:DUF2304 domain-containing protein [Phycicoccus jejuensis]|uniref:DUF2304 domain-containing protein n=1 Tax=Phycicoccus jejuensis TaxID=367299 RepID=UPI00384CC5DE